MIEDKIKSEILNFHDNLPKFPDGRINFAGSDAATVVTIVLRYRDKILLLKRSGKVSNYRGKWHVVGGYLDDLKTPKDKVLEELREELQISEKDIASIELKEIYKYEDEVLKKKWIALLVLAELKHPPKIKIDWEHTEYKWITPEELGNFDVIPFLDVIVKKTLGKN